MENYFLAYRKGIIGIDHAITTCSGQARKIVYADWTASGRNYGPIEERLQQEFMPLVANTHTDTNSTGMAMTHAYHQAQVLIKKHVNANQEDVLLSCGSGMTGVINKFQRILGLKLHERYKHKVQLDKNERPIVFITHMEHHSNQTSWLETIAEVEIIPPNQEGLVDLVAFEKLLEHYKDRPLKIAAITSCSNVTGIFTPYHEIAKMIHHVGGYCFVDFACSAPYIDIDMHPDEEGAHLDAVFFSPHKFLGGPGTTGILVFNRSLYQNTVPDHPGGGTVSWTNPWKAHRYFDDIETREDGGTPAFLQTIKVAMCVTLKEEMGTENMLKREHQMMQVLWERFSTIDNLHILAPNVKDRLGIISFYIDGLHYNLGVKILNDRFGIQTRGGCSCAGTYGHYLLNVAPEQSNDITSRIDQGDCSSKPGWIRLSIHPTMTDDEISFLADSIAALALNYKEWSEDYICNWKRNAIMAKEPIMDMALKQQIEYSISKPFVRKDQREKDLSDLYTILQKVEY